MWGKGSQGLKVTILLVFPDQQTSGCVSRLGLKLPVEPKSAFCRKFGILASPWRKNKSEDFYAENTWPALFPPPPPTPTKIKAGGKDALIISCMVELCVGSNRQTRKRRNRSGRR